MREVDLVKLSTQSFKDGPVLVVTPQGRRIQAHRNGWVGRPGSPKQYPRYVSDVGEFSAITELKQVLALY